MEPAETHDFCLVADEPPGESATANWAAAEDYATRAPMHFHSTRAAPAGVVPVRRVVMPAGATAWGLSILLHGALAAAACLLVHHYNLLLGGRPNGQAPGESDVSLVSGGRSGPVIQSGLPQNTVAPRDTQPPLHKAESDEIPQDPSWSDHATRTSLSSADEEASRSDDFLVIGARGGSLVAPPAFHHAGMPRPPVGVGPAGGGSGAQGQGALTYPGLPGELAGRGFPKPDYPVEARRRGETGTVVVELEIRADGSVGRIRVLEEPGYPMLREAALAAAEKLRDHRFKPATRDGRPVSWVAPIRYQFFLR